MSKGKKAKKRNPKPGAKESSKPASEATKTGDQRTTKTQINELEREIIEESKKIARNEIHSCYTLVQKTKELMQIEKVLS